MNWWFWPMCGWIASAIWLGWLGLKAPEIPEDPTETRK